MGPARIADDAPEKGLHSRAWRTKRNNMRRTLAFDSLQDATRFAEFDRDGLSCRPLRPSPCHRKEVLASILGIHIATIALDRFVRRQPEARL